MIEHLVILVLELVLFELQKLLRCQASHDGRGVVSRKHDHQRVSEVGDLGLQHVGGMTSAIVSFTIFTVIGGFLIGDFDWYDFPLALGTGTGQVEHFVLLRLELHDARVNHKEMCFIDIVLVLKRLFDF